jgi:hypothetical protein
MWAVRVNVRLRKATFVQAGIGSGRRVYKTCNTPVQAAVPGVALGALPYQPNSQQVDNPENAETPEGCLCDQTYPCRPDAKLLASHSLPWGFK